jgi:hypothetical protein
MIEKRKKDKGMMEQEWEWEGKDSEYQRNEVEQGFLTLCGKGCKESGPHLFGKNFFSDVVVFIR